MDKNPKLHLVKSDTTTSAESLIVEAARNTTGPPAPIAELVLELPDYLRHTLDALLLDFDYRANLRSNAAIACRMLAAAINSLETRLQGDS